MWIIKLNKFSNMSKEAYNEAFMNTIFKVALNPSDFYEIWVGQENVLVDLKLSGVSSWAYITAWNPLPTTYTLDENPKNYDFLPNFINV
jgi:hypothetical protein